MAAGGRRFRPALWPSVATALLLPLLLGLGFWQLDRADQKRAQGTLYAERSTAPYLRLPMSRMAEDDLLWYRAEADGRWGGPTILLDNQVQDRKAGYLVLTPLALGAEGPWLLVARGWLAAGDRQQAPAGLPQQPGQPPVRGQLAPYPATGIPLGGAELLRESLGEGLVRVQVLDAAAAAGILGGRVLPVILRQEFDADDGLRREWLPPGTDVHRHLGYAVQWFALAAALLVIYVLVNLRRSSAAGAKEPTP